MAEQRKLRKRAAGEGTIRQRKPNLWEGMMTVPQPDGTSKRQSFYGKTQVEVREKMTAVRHTLDRGGVVVTERQTVGQFLDRWLEDVVRPNLRPRTYGSYRHVVNLHLKPGLGKHRLEQLTPQQVQAFLNAKLAAGLSPRTVAYLRAVLRQALNRALKWGQVARNVATLVDPPRAAHHEPVTLTPAQATRLLAAAQGDRLEALYAVAVALGLRQGEVLGLRWEDVDFDAGQLHVRVALQWLNGQRPILVEPKTKQSRRTIAMPQGIAAQLRAHRTRQREQRLRAGERWQGEQWGLVFPSTVGTPIEPRNLVKSFKVLLERAGLPDMRFHDLRHSCLSLLAAQGVPPRVAMEIAGHSDIRLTLGVYTHAHDQAKRQAAEGMDWLFGFPDTGT